MEKRRNLSLALSLAAMVAGMLMLAYASVPLYRLFCQVTGFGGTPKKATTLPSHAIDRFITVRFNADTAPDLNWEFKAPAPVKVQVGAPQLISYTAKNLGKSADTGTATFNVTPVKAAPYFVKVQCFCFNEQTLPPDSRVNMPVSFYIDPAIAKDRQLSDVHTITLSYTFFHVNKTGKK